MDGGRQSRVPDGHYTDLSDATWVSSTDVVSVGTSTDTNENYDPLIEQWDGRGWTVAAVPEYSECPLQY